MTIHPQRSGQYEPPPRAECEKETHVAVLMDGNELRCIWWFWADTYVADFSIVQVTRVDGEWHEVARVDCKHSEVHKHQLSRSRPNDDQGIRTPLAVIPAQRGWELVDSWYGQALTLMEETWQENKRRWGGDHE